MQRRASHFLMLSLVAGSLFACSKSNEVAPELPDATPLVLCDPAKCAPGNICVQDRCRRPCARHTDCPGNYDCRTLGDTPVCVENNMPIAPGAFGTSCGLGGDSDCTAEGFLCFGKVGDPDAYCTRKGCQSDAECPGNYFCSTVDSVADAGVTTLCRKRDFCAPATSLTDCNDPQAVFMQDSEGNGYCAKTCTGNNPNGCGVGNGCFSTDSGAFVCVPRSKSCKPTHTFCSRCWSDADCPAGGFCFEADMSHERFCTQPCTTTASCPKLPGGGAATCYKTTSGNQCLPTIDATTEAIQSCWTPLPRTGASLSAAHRD